LKVNRSVAAKAEFAEKCHQSKIQIVVDCGFDALQTEKEIKSLAQQIMLCYGANRRSSNPVNLVVSGIKGEVERALTSIGGFESWQCRREGASFEDLFEHNRLVYLTSDSLNEVEAFDDEKVYVIGGIVDRNRYKGISAKKASELNISTARLPIRNHVSLNSSQVLTVNQVFQIILKFLETRDWKSALMQSIPQRKMLQASHTTLLLSPQRAV